MVAMTSSANEEVAVVNVVMVDSRDALGETAASLNSEQITAKFTLKRVIFIEGIQLTGKKPGGIGPPGMPSFGGI